MNRTDIQKLELSDKDREINSFLQILSFPKDFKLFTMLPTTMIKRWVYGLDPKLAIVITCDPRFKALLEYKQHQTFISRALDKLTRKFHYGLNF